MKYYDYSKYRKSKNEDVSENKKTISLNNEKLSPDSEEFDLDKKPQRKPFNFTAILGVICIIIFINVGMVELKRSKENAELTNYAAIYTYPYHVAVDGDLWQLVQLDADADLAYYTPRDATRIMNIGDIVYTPYGDEATVLYTDYRGFAIDHNNTLSAGDSGKTIRNIFGDQLATVDKMLNDGTVYCLYTIY